jgi:hypothetical protein
MKYTDIEDWESLKDYKKSITNGELSPFISFDDYQEARKLLDENLIGFTTSDGIEIKGYKPHFVDRYFGSGIEQHRSGVGLFDIMESMTNPNSQIKNKITKQGNASRKYIGDVCEVSLNPKTNILIQTNPH